MTFRHAAAAAALFVLCREFMTALAKPGSTSQRPGKMGSLVWTTPDALQFQINRNDVHAVNWGTNSFPHADTDYTSSCARIC